MVLTGLEAKYGAGVRLLELKYGGVCKCSHDVAMGGKVVYLKGAKPSILACASCDTMLVESAKGTAEAQTDLVPVRFRVQRITYAKPDGSWTIAKTEILDGPPELPKRKTVTIVGPLGQLSEGDEAVVQGKVIHDPRWGLQVKAFAAARQAVAETMVGLRNFLKRFEGVGAGRAEAIIAHFGSREEVLRILEQEPTKLAEVSGITEERAVHIAEEYVRLVTLRDAYLFLDSLEITATRQGRILDTWAAKSESIIREDPYELMALRGFGFAESDKVAKRLGVERNDPRRLRAISYMLIEDANKEGHTWIPTVIAHGEDRTDKYDSVTRAINSLGFSVEELKFGFELACAQGKIEMSFDGERYAVAELAECERRTARKLAAMARATVQPLAVPADVFAPLVPSDEQQEALDLASQAAVFVLTGGPGVGKTQTVNSIIRMCKRAGMSIELAAPTGKAARRMTELTGHDASTIHRLCSAKLADDSWTLDVDVVVVDECFTSRQPVLTEHGWMFISKIVNARLPIRVWSMNHDSKQLELKPIVRWLKNPTPANRQLLEINVSRTKDARRGTRLIRCTPQHKIYTPTGKVLAGALRVGDKVLVRGEQLTKFQQSILVGSILGDGGVNRHPTRKSAQVVLVQGDEQKDYLEFKRKIFADLAPVAVQGVSGYGDGIVWRCSLKVTDDTTAICAETWCLDTHISGRRRWTFSDDFLSRVDLTALAILYLDNGSVSAVANRSPRIMLHTQRFSECDNLRLSNHIRALGFDNKVSPDGKGYFQLRFDKENSARFLAAVAALTPACMAYKVPGYTANFEPASINVGQVCEATIKTIRPWIAKSSHVFDLEVADNHNYIAGNVIVSNCSMVDCILMDWLLSCLNVGTRLILVGDVDQLPSVGPGSVLDDIIRSGAIATVRLSKIFRQSSESAIPYAARDIIEGRCPDLDQKGSDFVFVDVAKLAEDTSHLAQEDLPRYYAQLAASCIENLAAEEIFDVERFKDKVRTPADVQVLAAQRSGETGVEATNRRLQQRLNPPPRTEMGAQESFIGRQYVTRVDDRVINKRNNYDLDIMNGETGRVLEVNRDGFMVPAPTRERPDAMKKAIIRVDFGASGKAAYLKEDIYDLELAYALTVHSFQGSQQAAVIIPVLPEHSWMLTSRLLYTAVTRAQHCVILVGLREIVASAARNRRDTGRRTMLRRYLEEGVEPAAEAPWNGVVLAHTLIPDGHYLVHDDLEDVVLRAWKHRHSDKRFVSRKTPSGVWEQVAHFVGSNIRLDWDYRQDEPLRRTMEKFVIDVAAAGREYGQTTSRCYMCHRELHDDASKARGLGPDCAEKVLTMTAPIVKLDIDLLGGI